MAASKSSKHTHVDIPGYNFGDPDLEDSPLSEREFYQLRESVTFTHDDKEALEMAGEVLEPHIDEIVDVWYNFVADNDFLLAYFSTPDGQPIEDYLERVRPRFERWIKDTCCRKYDGKWLAYQQEIAKRHTHIKKNDTDDVDAAPHIPLRYMITFIYPVTATVREYLDDSGHTDIETERMQDAFFKSVIMQVALWSAPYAKDGWF